MAETKDPTKLTRRRWRSWADFPPIDWAALAAEREANRPWRFGDPVPLHIWEKAEKGRARTRARKKRQATDRWRAQRSARFKAKRHDVLRAMVPGEWVAVLELARRVGRPRVLVYDTLRRLEHGRLRSPGGRVERMANPEPASGAWLYRLTPAGEALRATVQPADWLE